MTCPPAISRNALGQLNMVLTLRKKFRAWLAFTLLSDESIRVVEPAGLWRVEQGRRQARRPPWSRAASIRLDGFAAARPPALTPPPPDAPARLSSTRINLVTTSRFHLRDQFGVPHAARLSNSLRRRPRSRLRAAATMRPLHIAHPRREMRPTHVPHQAKGNVET